MTTILIEHPPGRAPERAYAYGIAFREYLGIGYRTAAVAREDVRISLDSDDRGAELLLPDVLFRLPDEDWLTPRAVPAGPLRTQERSPIAAEGLPLLYASHRPLEIDPAHRRVSLPLDVFGSLFFMLTRYEEVVGGERDAHDRFPARASLAHREGFLERPIVDEYLELLWSAMSLLWPGLERRERRHSIEVSHDVDWPLLCSDGDTRRLVRGMGGDLVRRRDPFLAGRRLRAWVDARRGRFDGDPANTFSFIMDLSERYGLKSAFYFIAAHTSAEHDGIYSLQDPWIRELIRAIGRRGHEVGLHASYNTYRDPAQTAAEYRTLRAACEEVGITQGRWGGRQHYLRWENPTTWQNWADAGLDYDSTLTFADHAGFRCGAAFEYPVFNLRSRRELALRERPLVVMEGSLLSYQGLDAEETLEAIAGLRAAVRRVNGTFTILWHNSSLITRAEKSMYLALWERLARS